MAEKKKSPLPSDPSRSADGQQAGPSLLSDLISREQLDSLSTLQLVDLIVSKLPSRHSVILDMVYLRERISSMEEMNDQARQTIEKLDAIVEKLRSPAFRVGTFLMPVEPERAHVCIGGTDYVCRVDPQIPLSSLQIGQRVLCNEAFAVVLGLGFDRNGPIVRIDELLSDGRLADRTGIRSHAARAPALGVIGQRKTQTRPGSSPGCQPTRRSGSDWHGQANGTIA